MTRNPANHQDYLNEEPSEKQVEPIDGSSA